MNGCSEVSNDFGSEPPASRGGMGTWVHNLAVPSGDKEQISLTIGTTFFLEVSSSNNPSPGPL